MSHSSWGPPPRRNLPNKSSNNTNNRQKPSSSSSSSSSSATTSISKPNRTQLFYQGENMPRNSRGSYDDEKGQFIMEIGDHIAYRYEIIKVMGKGSFSTVVKVFDHKRKNHLAIKVIRNDANIVKHSHKEIDILSKLQGEGHSIELLAHFFWRNHLCMITDVYSINLWQVLKLNSLQGLPLSQIRTYTIQLLECLDVLHRNNIIHCDLKPENILLLTPESTKLKVIDFGSSTFKDGKLFTYIQSRYYRAPEVIMELQYDTGIDMWSLACILVELFTGRPLFSGKDEAEQIQFMVAVLGRPPAAMVEQCRPSIRQVLATARGPTSSLEHAIGPHPEFVSFIADMLSGLLAWDLSVRLTPENALKHPFITNKQPRPSSRVSSAARGQPQHTSGQIRGQRVAETPYVPPTPMSYIYDLNNPKHLNGAHQAQQNRPSTSSQASNHGQYNQHSYNFTSNHNNPNNLNHSKSNIYQHSPNSNANYYSSQSSQPLTTSSRAYGNFHHSATTPVNNGYNQRAQNQGIQQSTGVGNSSVHQRPATAIASNVAPKRVEYIPVFRPQTASKFGAGASGSRNNYPRKQTSGSWR